MLPKLPATKIFHCVVIILLHSISLSLQITPIKWDNANETMPSSASLCVKIPSFKCPAIEPILQIINTSTSISISCLSDTELDTYRRPPIKHFSKYITESIEVYLCPYCPLAYISYKNAMFHKVSNLHIVSLTYTYPLLILELFPTVLSFEYFRFNITRVTVIDLRKTKLSPISFTTHMDLERLYTFRLYCNGEQVTLPNKYLANLPALEEVQMEFCQLTELPIDIFFGPRNIRDTSPSVSIKVSSIDLSFNLLRNVDEKCFSSLINLKTLRLSNNRITSISR